LVVWPLSSCRDHADIGHAPDEGLAPGQGEDDNASGIGTLNAAHASPRALANASPNSEVGRIGTYKEALDRHISDLNAGAPPAVLSADITAHRRSGQRPVARPATGAVEEGEHGDHASMLRNGGIAPQHVELGWKQQQRDEHR
jgi:hypothetical protein